MIFSEDKILFTEFGNATFRSVFGNILYMDERLVVYKQNNDMFVEKCKMYWLEKDEMCYFVKSYNYFFIPPIKTEFTIIKKETIELIETSNKNKILVRFKIKKFVPKFNFKTKKLDDGDKQMNNYIDTLLKESLLLIDEIIDNLS